MRRFFALVIALGLLAAPVSAQQPEERNQIITHGIGRIELAPDRAVLSLGVQIQRSTAAEATAAAARVVEQMLTRLQRLGVRRQDMRTSGIHVVPLFTTAQQISGFGASYTLTLTLNDLALVGPAIDEGVRAGANSVSGLRFGLRDDSQARRDALAAAVRDARERAETIAGAANLQIRGIERIVDEGVDVQVVDRGLAPGLPPPMPGPAPTPVVQPNMVIVTAQVTMIFSY